MIITIQCLNNCLVSVFWVFFSAFQSTDVVCLDFWNNWLGQILEDANSDADHQAYEKAAAQQG